MVMENATFAALPPVPNTLHIAGESLDITPLKIGELPAFARAVQPLAAKLGPEPDWLQLVAEEGAAVIQALAIACRKPADWVSALALDEAIALSEAVFEANADFFIRRVVPEVLRVTTGMTVRIGTLTPGPTSSSDSSMPDIATPTS